MNMLIAGVALFSVTVTAVAVYPEIKAEAKQFTETPVSDQLDQAANRPVVDVVFVLDTTSSMTGLIDTAKEKIWSIATTMSAAQPVPDIRIGLVAFRDRGDEYVTKVIDLSSDLDSVYAALMDFAAVGGGDGPESVNQGLYDAVHKMSWSQSSNAYQTIFLVGDAPPHMDYQDDVLYQVTLKIATDNGLIVNTIQCGTSWSTTSPWKHIAELGNGSYFQVEQDGGSIAVNTPFDKKIATLSSQLDGTRLYYGSESEKAKMQNKVDATAKLNASASIASRARRGAFNSSASGKKNKLGENELVEAISSGALELDALTDDEMPEELEAMAPAAQLLNIQRRASQRKELEQQIIQLTEKRAIYLSKKVQEMGNKDDSLEYKLFSAVQEQGAKVGLEYRDGPKY